MYVIYPIIIEEISEYEEAIVYILLYKLIPPWSTVRGAGSGYGVQKPVKPPKPDKRPQILPRPPALSSDHQDTFVPQSSSGVEKGNPKGCLVDVHFPFAYTGLF